MKKLLQNKKFRLNLYKWLSMYVCVMLLFTTVVTYSKYISSMGTDEMARVANFEVNIDFSSCPLSERIPSINEDGTKSFTCDMGISRPTSVLSYYFTVDTTKIEADAMLVISTVVSKDFEVLSLLDTTTNTSYIVDGNSQNGAQISTVNGDKKILLTSDVLAREGSVHEYKIQVQYKDSLVTDDTNKIFTSRQDIITVGYSALQKTR